MPLESQDRRRDARTPCSRSIWWRTGEDALYQQGWLLDESRKGVAFLTRTEDTPKPGEQILTASAEAETRPVPRGVVRRVQPIQSGVSLIAVELFAQSDAVVTRAVKAASTTPPAQQAA